MSIRDALLVVSSGRDLTVEQAKNALEDVIANEHPPTLLAGFLMALRTKGESPSEIAGLASAMREASVTVDTSDIRTVDTCGTGGDGRGTLNVSTAVGFVAAGCGLKVAKHGNRSLSSKCGSADVLEALGVKIELDASGVRRCIDAAGVGFMFAPAFHPAMRKLMAVRRELAVPTAFNVLGPLTNPARPQVQLVGVGAEHLGALVAGALAATPTVEAAMVVFGETDELTCSGVNRTWTVSDGQILDGALTAETAGLDQHPPDAIGGGNAEFNASKMRELLDGAPGAYRDTVLLNTAALLTVEGSAESIRQGVALSADAIDSGRALTALEALVRESNA